MFLSNLTRRGFIGTAALTAAASLAAFEGGESQRGDFKVNDVSYNTMVPVEMDVAAFANALTQLEQDLLADPTCWDPNLTDDEWDEWFYGNLEISPRGGESFNSGISIGFDARVSLTYNFGNFFINAFGQFNNIRFRQDDTHGHLNDWFVNSSFGIRL